MQHAALSYRHHAQNIKFVGVQPSCYNNVMCCVKFVLTGTADQPTNQLTMWPYCLSWRLADDPQWFELSKCFIICNRLVSKLNGESASKAIEAGDREALTQLFEQALSEDDNSYLDDLEVLNRELEEKLIGMFGSVSPNSALVHGLQAADVPQQEEFIMYQMMEGMHDITDDELEAADDATSTSTVN